MFIGTPCKLYVLCQEIRRKDDGLGELGKDKLEDEKRVFRWGSQCGDQGGGAVMVLTLRSVDYL